MDLLNIKIIISFFVVFIFNSCSIGTKDRTYSEFAIEEIPAPVQHGGEPNLFVSDSGDVYLSWIEYLNDTTDALMFSTLKSNQWTDPNTIASGSDWFVNWADFPSVVPYQGNNPTIAAHWLQKSAAGTYDYDIHISHSTDLGNTWDPSFIPYQDSIAAEYGFVSMVPVSKERMFVTWLDGRNTKKEVGDQGGHGHSGSMALRAAEFDEAGNLYNKIKLDDRVCDCCQTSAAMTDKGVIVAYRDRSEEEVRDISIVRQFEGRWTQPSPVYNDGWKISACPVNGPSIKATGAHVVVAWFTMAEGISMVKVVFSHDSGRSFSQPVRVDDGDPIGRVDVVMLSENEALVSWMEKTDDASEIRAVRVSPDNKQGHSTVISKSNTSRRSGFPVLAKNGDEIICAWTVGDSLTSVKTAKLTIDY